MIESKKQEIAKDIAEVLNKHSVENDSNTPDYLLAEMLVDQLEIWNTVSRAREYWFGHELCIGGPKKLET